MILAEAIHLAKQFPGCQPKIFNGFVECRSCGNGEEGYVVLFKAALANELYPNQIGEYIKSHKLTAGYFKDYLMIHTLL